MNDVLIIGCGPAGTSCAKKLAENGFSVKVFDRREELGVPVRCGEGLDERTQELIGKIPDSCISQKIKGARIYAPNGKYLEATLEYGGFVLNRRIFDKWLAEQAEKAGTEIQKNTLITDFIKENGYYKGVKGKFLGEEFEDKAKMLVCATGAESALRKALNIFSKLNLIDSCLQYKMSGIDINSDFIHIYLGNEIARRGYCLAEGTDIIMKNSLKKIEDIQVGEDVLTLNGWKPVANKSSRFYSGDILEIKPSMFNQEIRITPEHKILTWNEKEDFKWKHADEVRKRTKRKGDFLVFPISLEKEKVEYIDVSEFFKGIIKGDLIFPVGRNQFGAEFGYKHGIPKKLFLSDDLLEFFGYFVSEGNTNSSGIIISNTDKKIIKKVKDVGKKIFGFKASLWKDEKRKKLCIQVQFASRILKKLFGSLFGIGCKNKHIPYFIFTLDEDKKISFLKGLFRGDGNIEKFDAKNRKYEHLNLTTTSKHLIFDLWRLLASIGIVGSITRIKRKNAYRIRIFGKQNKKLESIFRKMKLSHRTQSRFKILNNMILLAVKSINRCKYEGFVYDLQTDGSFCSSFLVHNCWVFPKGKDKANVGAGIIPGKLNAKYYLDKFINKHQELKKGKIDLVEGGCVPVGDLLKDVVDNGLLICGEAAHHVNPIHGGGIKEAIISGQLAADVITDCLKKNDVSKKALSIFNDLWWEKRGKHLKNVEKLREVVEKLSDEDLNDLADALKPEDLIEFSRGSKLSVLAKALMRKPRLISLAKHLL